MTTYKEGIYVQSSYDEEADLGSEGLNYIGKPLTDNRPVFLIGMSENIIHRKPYGQYHEELESGVQMPDKIAANFQPVNGRFLYWFFGKRSASTGTRTIQNMDGSERKPSVSIWKQSNNFKRHVYGVIWSQLALKYANGMWVVNLKGQGLKVDDDSYSPSVSWEDSVNDHFNTISNEQWNSGDITLYALEANFNQPIEPIPDYDGLPQDISYMTHQSGTINLVCTATNGETLASDYISKTARTFTFTIEKSTNDHSLAFTFDNARIAQMEVTEELGSDPVYNMLLHIEDVSISVTDGL